jgi:hypothetical protein
LRSARSPGQAKNYSKLKIFSNVEKETVQRIYIWKKKCYKRRRNMAIKPCENLSGIVGLDGHLLGRVR